MSWKHYQQDGTLKVAGDGIPPQGLVMAAHRILGNYGPHTGWRVAVMDTLRFDPFQSLVSLASTRFQPKIPGYYRVAFNCRTNVNPGQVVAAIWKNTTTEYARLAEQQDNSATINVVQGGSCIVYLNGTTDYVEPWVYTSNNVAILGDAQGGCGFYAELVGVTTGVIPEPYRVIGSAGESVVFTNGWTHYDLANGRVGKFFKDPHGIVHIEGIIKSGTLGGTAFTLPVGYRPGDTVDVMQISGGALGSYLQINPDGSVMPQGSSNAYFYMSGISFRAEK